MADDTNYIIGLSFFEGIGPVRYRLLKDYFGSAKQVFEASKDDLLKVGLSNTLVNQFILFRQKVNLASIRSSMRDKKIDIVTEDDSEYPVLLSETKGAPFILYTLGEKDLLLHPFHIGVVGTRNPTTYGISITRTISRELAESGCCIVSGMAMGIDAIAHSTALSSEGKTIAVLGCGVDICYPAINFELYQRIIKKGLIISEFPPGMKSSKGVFPSRNRIVAGMSKAIVVTEGAEKSGSLITARFAGEFGREVYAVPGPVTSSLSYASHYLLKNGAKIAISASDILADFKIKPVPRVVKEIDLTPTEQKIVELLRTQDAMHIDEIGRELALNPSELSIVMSTLLVKGVLTEQQNGEYTIIR